MVKNRSKSSRISLLFIMIYNTLLITGGLFLAPLLLPLVWTTEKRRRTFCQRMGWCRYPWETEKQSTESQRIWVHALSVGEAMSAYCFDAHRISNGTAALWKAARSYRIFPI
ncbi:MAG: hypothetical protein P8X96_15840 [Desulfobacteraceae bacterium]